MEEESALDLPIIGIIHVNSTGRYVGGVLVKLEIRLSCQLFP